MQLVTLPPDDESRAQLCVNLDAYALFRYFPRIPRDPNRAESQLFAWTPSEAPAEWPRTCFEGADASLLWRYLARRAAKAQERRESRAHAHARSGDAPEGAKGET